VEEIIFEVKGDTYIALTILSDLGNGVLLSDYTFVLRSDINFVSETEICKYFTTLEGVQNALKDKLRSAKGTVARLEHNIQLLGY